ncbi:hypothetical protein LLG39_00970 [bacterium]|nr:hypothetical protein [bacterium]
MATAKHWVMYFMLVMTLASMQGCKDTSYVYSRNAGQKCRTLVSTRIPGHGNICYKECYNDSSKLYMYTVHWKPSGGQQLDYSVWTGGNHLPRNVELRAKPDYSGIWIVAENSIIASLDIKRRVFIGLNGIVMDPSLPIDEQEQKGQAKGQPGHPDWAVADGGIVLATHK